MWYFFTLFCIKPLETVFFKHVANILHDFWSILLIFLFSCLWNSNLPSFLDHAVHISDPNIHNVQIKHCKQQFPFCLTKDFTLVHTVHACLIIIYVINVWTKCAPWFTHTLTLAHALTYTLYTCMNLVHTLHLYCEHVWPWHLLCICRIGSYTLYTSFILVNTIYIYQILVHTLL